jgi:hypothetical protein
LVLTPGQAGDCPVATHLLGRLREDTIALADRDFDTDWLRRRIEAAARHRIVKIARFPVTVA